VGTQEVLRSSSGDSSRVTGKPDVALALEVPVCRNPVSPAVGLHRDSALVNPVHDQKIVNQVVGIPRTLTPKSVMGKGLVAD
jgi:hypothetical protein